MSAGNLETGILELITDYERPPAKSKVFPRKGFPFKKPRSGYSYWKNGSTSWKTRNRKRKTAASDGGDDEINRTKSDIEYAAGAYLDAAIRLYGDSPDLRNYADCEKYSKELRASMKKRNRCGIDTFALAEKSALKTRDDWMKAAEARKKLDYRNLSVQKAYEE